MLSSTWPEKSLFKVFFKKTHTHTFLGVYVVGFIFGTKISYLMGTLTWVPGTV